jgi:ABC-type amino acid transport substrate-binding protein
MGKLFDKRDFLRLLGSAAVAAPTAIVASEAVRDKAAPEKASVFDRVMKTRTIRCGYGIWPPFIVKDPNTGKLSGIFYDYMEALGQALSLKIDWAEESGGHSDFIPALTEGRIDAMCFSVWPNAARAQRVDFTAPVYYTAHYAYARAGDPRFDNNLDTINDASVTIAAIDGEMGALIAASDFPKAKKLELPETVDPSQAFLSIIDGKADVFLTDLSTAAEFEHANPGKIRQVKSAAPLRVFRNTIAIAQKQDQFRRMLDTATEELLSSGKMEKIIARYERYPNTFLRVEPGYQQGYSLRTK